MMSDGIPEVLAALLSPLFGTLDALERISRQLHPPLRLTLIDQMGDLDTYLQTALEQLQAAVWPEPLLPFRDQLALACIHALRAADSLRAAPAEANPLFAASRALRQTARAAEALYQIATLLPPVSRFFLEPDCRTDDSLLARLAHAPEGTGIMHASNETGMRGGFSVYVPESINRTTPTPVVFALHGGSGHGRLFLWNWVREARTHEIIVVAPTARGDTWSLMDPDTDASNLTRILTEVRDQYAIDPARVLLTGMSDGGTFTLLSGLNAASPFTHLAPVAASFHPMMLAISEPARIEELPVYLVHGALDWMFPVTVARSAHQSLRAAGARITYREIPDLSHTYPRDENPLILKWFLA